MSRTAAKRLTAAGIFCCVSGAIFFVYGLTAKVVSAHLIAPPLFVFGAMLVAASLAYYTEK